MRLPDCSPCGLAVDWSRRCYRSEWHLFADDIESTTAGRYYRCPNDTPFVAGYHHYGSREWYETNWQHIQWLGEDLLFKTKWNSGVPPAILPENRVVGSLACIANGGRASNQLPYSAIFDGIPRTCFAPGALTWPLVSTFSSCSLQYFYATILLWMYDNNPGKITTAFQMLVPGCVVTWKQGTYLFPDLICVTTPDWTVLVSDGTQTYQQWAMQGFGGITPPTNIGSYGTLPLWYFAATRALDFMTECGANVNGKFMLVGHSYGGSSIYNVAARLRIADATRVIHTLTFGSPKPGDSRMFDLLDTTSGMAMANDQDIVCSVPPDFATLFPVLAITGLIGLTVWDFWQHPPGRARQDPLGALTLNATPILDTGYLLSLLSRIIANQPFADVLTHPTEVYRRRIFLRCPCDEWPVDEELCEFLTVFGDLGLTGREDSVLGELGLGGDDAALGELGLGGPDVDALGELGLGADDAALGEIGLEAPEISDDLGLGGPGVDALGELGEVGLGGEDVDTDGSIGLGTSEESADGDVGLGDDGDGASGELVNDGETVETIEGGSDCATAPTITLGTNYILTTSTTLNYWFKVASPPAIPSQYTFTHIYTGSMFPGTAWQGECGSQTFIGALNNIPEPSTFSSTTVGSFPNEIYIIIGQAFGSGFPYQFKLTSP